ncbi:MAG: type B 50S ribosomal protein L31 [Propionibacteriaceae bacterium]|nr:type B 50S ribosomal protein L31 [Propionibacteriaceae bacterium]
MKPGIHPDYHPVVFRDISTQATYLTRSTLTSQATIAWEDGNTYPLVDVEISADSHPFYTGKARRISVTGRVEQFQRRYGKTL